MAEILTTKESVAALENIIRNAEQELFLISYSFIISDHFIRTIRRATERNVKVTIVYGQSIDAKASEQLMGLRNTKIFYLANLHAKIFANEVKCVLGSMNFSEASEKNNSIELGVLLKKELDASEFKEAVKHCRDFVKESKLKHESPGHLEVPFESGTQNKKSELGRSEFVLSKLEEHYGPVGIEREGYFKLRAYGVEVYLGGERIDFIFESNLKYEACRPQIAKELKSRIKGRFWVNAKRVNITAQSNPELEIAILTVMGFTLSRLI